MKDNNEGIKFLFAEINSFKGIDSKIVDIGGRSLVIVGGNGENKSSFIQVLKSSLDSDYLPDKPLKEGEEKGSFKVTIGGEIDGHKKFYNIEYFFTPKNGKGKIVVTNESGEPVKSPKSSIDALVGDISFDVFKFINQPKSKQIEVLKSLTGKGKEIDLLYIKKKDLMKEKNDKLQEVTFYEKTVGEHTYTDDELDLYNEPKDDTELKNKLETLSVDWNNWNKVKTGIKERDDRNYFISNELLSSLDEEIIALENKIAAKRKEKEDAEKEHAKNVEDIKKGEAWLESHPEPNVQVITDSITLVSYHNEQHRRVKELQQKQLNVIKLKQEADKLGDDIKATQSKIEDTISSSALPVKGLTFTEDEVLYNGLPFDDKQLNTAKIIEVGMQIGMALNPKLRCVFIQDGALLDKQSLKTVVDMCNKSGYQLIIETVRFEGGDLQIHYTEDYLK